MHRSLVLCLAALMAAACTRPSSPPLVFPTPFAWGVTSAALSIEGASGQRGPTVWDGFVSDMGLEGLDATDFHGRFEEDVQLLAALDITHFRFSLSWARLFPEGTGARSEEGFAFYDALIEALRAAQLEPVVTLHHRDLPQALTDRGGWASPDSPEWFADYAAASFEAFGDRVPVWVTFNEPYVDRVLTTGALERGLVPDREAADSVAALQASLERAPPFVRARRASQWTNPSQVSAGVLAHAQVEIHHQLLGHAAAVRAFRAAGQDGDIGIALRLAPVYPASEDSADVAAARIEDGLRNRWLLDPLTRGAYPEDIVRLGGTNLDASPIGAAGTDFIGVNYYAPTRVRADSLSERFGVRVLPNPDVDKAHGGEAYARGLSDILTRIDRDYDHPPIYVTENGTGFGPLDEVNENGRIRDELRVRYLRRHLVQAARAAADGVDLRGYFVRSAFDGFEWTDGWEHRYGLIHIDPLTGERTFKDSARYYRGIVATGEVSRLPF